jgi:hypothetical protein
MKLYTEDQVRQAIKKSRSVKNKDGDVFDYYFSDDEAIDFLTPIEFPNYKEYTNRLKLLRGIMN